MEIDTQSSPDEPGGRLPPGLGRVARGMGAFGALLVLALALLINADILSRFLLNHPLRGVAEMVELTIVVIVFVQLPLTIATGGLVRASELHEKISRHHPRTGKGMTFGFEVTGAVLFALLAWGLWPELAEAWRDNLFKGQPGLFTAPTWPALLATVVGSALSALCFAASAVMRLRAQPAKEQA